MAHSLQPRTRRVAALTAWGCSLAPVRLQHRVHGVAASLTNGCSLRYVRLQVPLELFQSRPDIKPRGVQARQWDTMKLARMESFCTSSNHTMLPDGRMVTRTPILEHEHARRPSADVADCVRASRAASTRRAAWPTRTTPSGGAAAGTRTCARGTTAPSRCGSRTPCRGWSPTSTTSRRRTSRPTTCARRRRSRTSTARHATRR